MIKVKSTVRIKLFSVFLVLVFLELITFVISFRFLRDYVIPVHILEGEKTSIGYSQFFGYPFYLDSIIFVILLACPVVFVIIAKTVSTRWE